MDEREPSSPPAELGEPQRADGEAASPARREVAEEDLEIEDIDALARRGAQTPASLPASAPSAPPAPQPAAEPLAAPSDDLGWGDEPAEPPRPALGARTPWIAGIVLIGGLWLLWALLPDVRYWMQGSRPLDLGEASEWVERASDGRAKVPGGFDDRYITLSATPDVQHAAVMVTSNKKIGWLRLREGGGALFAALPNDSGTSRGEFAGTFTGRLRRLDQTPRGDWVREFFDGERIVESVDLEVASLISRMGTAPGAAVGKTVALAEGGEVTLVADDRLVLVVRPPLSRLQLGVDTWPDVASAEAAVAGLGVPWTRLSGDAPAPAAGADPTRTPRKQLFNEFLVAAKPDAAQALAAQLVAGLDIPATNLDPKLGAYAVAHTASLSAPVDSVAMDASGAVTLAYGDNTSKPSWTEQEGRLVPTPLAGGRITVPSAQIIGAELHRSIRVDPTGYVILVEDVPASYFVHAILFLVVLGIVLANAVALVFAIRRAAAAAA